MEPVSKSDFDSRLKDVFEVCDPQNLGYITVERFVDLASEHFGADAINAEELAEVIHLLDPQQDGKIEFDDFCRGVQKIVEIQQNQFGEGAIHEPVDPRERSRSLSHSPVSFWREKYNDDDDARSMGGAPKYKNDVIMRDSSSTGTLIDVCNNDVSMPTVLVHSPGTSTIMPHFDEATETGNGHVDSSVEHFEDFGEVETESNMTYSSSHSAEQVSSSSPFTRLHRSSSRSMKSGKFRTSQNGSGTNSRRSSVSDIDIFGDIDGSFHELNEKVKNLEQQLVSITSSQSENDIRHLKLKDENNLLNGKVHNLEEQLKDVEIRSWEQRSAEQKRHIELMMKQERAMIREVESLRITTGNVQNECLQLKHDIERYKGELERLRQEKKDSEYQLQDARDGYDSLKEEHDLLQSQFDTMSQEVAHERQVNGELLDELGKELEELRLYKIEVEQAERCRSPSFNEHASRYKEMSVEVKQLLDENKRLKEVNEEMQAQILNQTIHEGRKLLRGNSQTGPSIADEMGDVPREELLQALREQEEANIKLRDYVARITLTILEKNPSLLEVTTAKNPS